MYVFNNRFSVVIHKNQASTNGTSSLSDNAQTIAQIKSLL